MTKRDKKRVAISVGMLGLIAVAFVFYLSRRLEEATIREGLARAFNRPFELIELNIPPAVGRYPGAILVSPATGQTLALRQEFRPDPDAQAPAQLETTIRSKGDAGISSRFFGNAASSGDIVVEMILDDLRVFEIPLDSKLRESLLSDETVLRAQKRGANPRIVTRAYEAVLSTRTRRAGSMSAELWTEGKKRMIDAGGELKEDGSIAFRGMNPEAIAYETVSVNYVAGTLSHGSPKAIEFRQVIAPETGLTALNPKAFGVEAADSGVRFALLGNDKYDSPDFGDLDVVAPSLDLISELFVQLGAKPLAKDSFRGTLTRPELEARLESIIEQLKNEKPSMLVLYYCGHGLTGAGGQINLVLSDYDGDVKEDLKKSLSVGLARAQASAPYAPLSGTNIDDIMGIANVLASEFPEDIPGLYPVSLLHRKLTDAGIPFVLLVDACYSVEEMDKLRTSLGLTVQGDYFGPNIDGGPSEYRQYAEAIQQFGEVPYLRSDNAVILSAAPGTVAMPVYDPRPSAIEGPSVGPLAQRLHRRFEAALALSQSLSWGDFFYSIVDVKRVGVVEIQGAASWSDFESAKRIPMLKPVEKQ